MTMRVGSLFSGIGGMDLGLERAGMEIVWQVEVDEWCRRVLARHFPNAVRYGDVRTCHGAAVADANGKRSGAEAGRRVAALSGNRSSNGGLAPVDLICGGFPCQPVSHAGRRLGAEDDRWLWPEFHRIIREVRPRWILVENVPGLLSIDAGRLFGGVLRDLAESGYDAEWDHLPAAAFGTPHIRDRVFIVAHSAGRRSGRTASVGEGRERRAGLDERSTSGGEDVADADVAGQPERTAQRRDVGEAGREAAERGYMAAGSATNTDEHSPFWASIPRDQCGHWAVEPNVGRVAHGVPARVDRLRGLGNAVVPQVAEHIGWLIMEANRG